MLNFENLDKANFLGVGKYDTPIIQPEHIDVRHLEWIPFDKALVSKDRATKACISTATTSCFPEYGIILTSTSICFRSLEQSARRIFAVF